MKGLNCIRLSISAALVFTMGVGIMYGQASKKKVDFTGLGRAYYFNNAIKHERGEDTINAPRNNYGTTLIDLGVNVFPNKNTEILGVFRISNELGGFWGGGADFTVRQLTLKGVAADKVRYKLGDIDLKLTNYTVFNNQEDGFLNEADVFSIRRDVAQYEQFYIENYWRMQGGQMEFGLKPAKLIDEINFNGFLTRQNVTDGISTPERLLGGGSVQFLNIKQAQVTYNNTSIFDLTQTANDTAIYKNQVHSIGWSVYHKYGAKLFSIGGESGFSNTKFAGYSNPNTPEDFDDSFMEVVAKMKNDSSNLSVSVGFMDVGPEFRSPSAQSKRMDYSKPSSLYSTITNNNILRPVSTFDYLSLSSQNNRNISYELQDYFVFYNNTMPYGKATPNRKGLFLNASKGDSAKGYSVGLDAYLLSEIRGEGTFQKRSFNLIKLQTNLNINKWIKWRRNLELTAGVRYEGTKRSGEWYEEINFTSVLADLGLTVEAQDNLDLMVGRKMISGWGNEFIDQRNQFNELQNIGPSEFGLEETISAMGVRYRFTKKVHLSAVWQKFKYGNYQNDLNYKVNQFYILYNMKF